jgi:hypothetical protein
LDEGSNPSSSTKEAVSKVNETASFSFVRRPVNKLAGECSR